MNCFWPDCGLDGPWKVLGTAIVCCDNHLAVVMGCPFIEAIKRPLVYYVDHDTDALEPVAMTRKMRQQLKIGELTADMGIFNV